MIPHIRRVIDAKSYDTRTAELVHVCVNDALGYRDFYTEWTGIFLTSKGTWFVAGTGGALSRWSQYSRQQGGMVAGEGLKLLSVHEAMSLLAEYDGPVEGYFDIESQ